MHPSQDQHLLAATMTDLSTIIKVEKKSTIHHDSLSLFTVLGDE